MIRLTGWMGKKRMVVALAAVGTVCFGLGATVSSWGGLARTKLAAPRKVTQSRAERMARVRQLDLDERRIGAFLVQYGRVTRGELVARGYLQASAPAQGGKLIGTAHRTEKGARLLQEAKDLLYGLLFGDAEARVRLRRTERELLTLTVPRSKADPVEFMQASTELKGAGNWQDPENVANDSHADNTIIEVEYGEVGSERVGDGILAALRVINLLEVNEQLLYARMNNVEQSSLTP